MAALKDFLGQPLAIDDYFVLQGSGNRKAEYGLILYQVVGFKNGKIRAQRLDVNYHWYDKNNNRLNAATIEVVKKTSTIQKRGKLVRVDPPKGMIEVFQNPEDYPELVGKWVHGQTEIDWEKKKALSRWDA